MKESFIQNSSELMPEVCPTPPYTADEICSINETSKKEFSNNHRSANIHFSTISKTEEIPDICNNLITKKNSWSENKDDPTLSVVQVNKIYCLLRIFSLPT